MPLTPEQLHELERLERAATKAPWFTWCTARGTITVSRWDPDYREPDMMACIASVGGDGSNAALIERCRNLLPALISTARYTEGLRNRIAAADHETEQILAQAIGGYPWYKDDLKNFPGATEKDGVCVGEHVPQSLAMQAANVIGELRRRVAELEAHMRLLLDNSQGFNSAIEMDLGASGSDWHERARKLVGQTS